MPDDVQELTIAYMYCDNKRRERNNGPIDEKRGAEAGMLDVTEVGSDLPDQRMY